MEHLRPSDALPRPAQLVGEAAAIEEQRQTAFEQRLQFRLRREEIVREIEEYRMPAVNTFQLEERQMDDFLVRMRAYGQRIIQNTRSEYVRAAAAQRAEDKEEEELWGSDDGEEEDEGRE